MASSGPSTTVVWHCRGHWQWAASSLLFHATRPVCLEGAKLQEGTSTYQANMAVFAEAGWSLSEGLGRCQAPRHVRLGCFLVVKLSRAKVMYVVFLLTCWWCMLCACKFVHVASWLCTGDILAGHTRFDVHVCHIIWAYVMSSAFIVMISLINKDSGRHCCLTIRSEFLILVDDRFKTVM